MALYVMLLMQADPLLGQAGGGWALEISTFLGPNSTRLTLHAISHVGPKKVDFPVALPLALFMDLPAS
jgi:hypothetical protein